MAQRLATSSLPACARLLNKSGNVARAYLKHSVLRARSSRAGSTRAVFEPYIASRDFEMAVITTNDLIAEHVKGLSFVDIGGLWGTNNERVTVALTHQAKSATMMDIVPMGHELWRKFDQRAKEAGFAGQYKSISANLDDPDLTRNHGTFDFVHCSGIIYHAPSPFHTLMSLRALTRKYLVLGSMTVPEKISTASGQIDMSDGAAYFIPALSRDKLAIFKEHFDALDVKVHNINTAETHKWLASPGMPNYGPWWWLWTPDTLARMAETAGFKLIGIFPGWKDRAHGIFLEAA